MNQQEILNSLCYYDERNPESQNNPEIMKLMGETEKIIPTKNCSCDSCFRGKNELALEILRLQERIEDLEIQVFEESLDKEEL